MKKRLAILILLVALILLAVAIVSVCNRKAEISEDDAGAGEAVGLASWISGYEIPANAALSVTESDEMYCGRYCHSTVTERFGDTRAVVYNLADTTRKIVVHTYSYNGETLPTYTLLFDKSKRCALWVAFRHEGTYCEDNNVGRCSQKFVYDPALPKAWQPNLSSSYVGDFDRGHQVASNDRQTTSDQNAQTFYDSNMTPQFNILNQNHWRLMEESLQNFMDFQATAGRTVYVVTGPLFEGAVSYTTDKSGNDCALPTGYFKCAVSCELDSAGICVGCPASRAYIIRTNNVNKALDITTIDNIESLTGLDLFPSLPDSYERAIEAARAAE